MKLAVIIPAHNEAKTVQKVVRDIPRRIDGISAITPYVVDDASSDNTAELAHRTGVNVIRHPLNLGQGGAVLTGLVAARKSGNEIAVCLDSDGQHDPNDIHMLVSEYHASKADLIIGSRFLSQTIEEMPALKWYGNKAMNGMTFAFSGARVTDSQSGFRLFGQRFLEVIEEFNMTGYEFCSETIISAKRRKLLVKEVPIRTIYYADRRGQNPLNALNIFLKLFYRSVAG